MSLEAVRDLATQQEFDTANLLRYWWVLLIVPVVWGWNNLWMRREAFLWKWWRWGR